jgi:glycerophosphoryl diester phosphodiesterase
MPRFRFLDHPGLIPFAHRGKAAGNVENTLAAFQAVVDLGYRYVETDVRTTRDGKLVVFHDRTLERIAGVDREVGALRYADLTDLAVPLLTDVLETFPDVRFNVDMKDWPSVEALAAVIEATTSIDRLCAASFSERRLRRIRRLAGPELCTSAGVAGVARFVLRWPGPIGGAAAVQVPASLVRPSLVERARRRHLHYHVWTLNDRDSIVRAVRAGVHGIMTDEPVLLKDVLQALGRWVA